MMVTFVFTIALDLPPNTLIAIVFVTVKFEMRNYFPHRTVCRGQAKPRQFATLLCCVQVLHSTHCLPLLCHQCTRSQGGSRTWDNLKIDSCVADLSNAFWIQDDPQIKPKIDAAMSIILNSGLSEQFPTLHTANLRSYTSGRCLTSFEVGGLVIQIECDPMIYYSQSWIFGVDGSIRRESDNLCMTLAGYGPGNGEQYSYVLLGDCNGSQSQRFTFLRHTKDLLIIATGSSYTSSSLVS